MHSQPVFATALVSIVIALIVQEVADKDESIGDFHDAFMVSLPCGGATAGVWLVLLIVTTYNIGGAVSCNRRQVHRQLWRA
jgi:hypothetical protein